MVYVQFSRVEEFLEQLEADAVAGVIGSAELRVSRAYHRVPATPIQTLSVHGGYVQLWPRGMLVVRVVEECGELWGNGMGSDERTHERANGGVAALEAAAERHGLAVRRGAFQVG